MDYHELSITQKINYRRSGLLLAGIVAFICFMLPIQDKYIGYLITIPASLVILTLLDSRLMHILINCAISLGNFIHIFTNPLVFGFLYLVVVIPTSLALKLSGKDILQLKLSNNSDSYWTDRTDSKLSHEFFSKQF